MVMERKCKNVICTCLRENWINIRQPNTKMIFDSFYAYLLIYSVSPKNPPYGFLTFFPNGWEFLINFLHIYYAIISTLECKFLFKYLQH